MIANKVSRLTRGALAAPLLACLLVGCGTAPVGGGTGGTATASNDVTLLEQLSLERINRARLRPAAEAAAGGINLNEGVPAASAISTAPKQALAMNASLRQAARAHSEDLLARDYFEHVTPEGLSPFDRMTNAGYLFTSAGENLAWRGTTGATDEMRTVEDQHNDLFVDTGYPDRGHRTTMLHEVFREVGIGVIRGVYTQGGLQYDSVMQTQDYGVAPSSGTFVLGVVYNDSNSNGQYDYGEGVENFAVELAGVSKTTNVAGGYSFEVRTAGAYTLRFASGPSQALAIDAGDRNIKVDLVGSANVVVNLGLGELD